jgi:hypothetical protein
MEGCGLREFQQMCREIGIFAESEKKLEEMGIISLLAMEMNQRNDERAEFRLTESLMTAALTFNFASGRDRRPSI